MSSERREYRRLKLAKPILATMRDENALILDLGLGGAFVEHYGVAHPDERFSLSFRWQGEPVEFECRVVRSNVVRSPGGDGQHPVSHTGVDFVLAAEGSRDRLQSLITTFVGRILDAQRSNASGTGSSGEMILARLGGARRMRSRGYLAYRLREGVWSATATDSPVQPGDGFTVGTFEDEQEIEDLCRTYERADEEGRRLIRLVAELTSIPPRP